MKNLLGYLTVASLLLFASCQNEEQDDTDLQLLLESHEPDYINMNDNLTFTTELQQKSGYTLLTPSGLKRGDVAELACDEAITYPLLVGSQKKRVGRVFVSNDAENLYITIKTNQYQLMKKTFFYIGAKENIPFHSNGFPKVNKFNYKAFPTKHNGDRRATYIIPLSSIDIDCFEIVAYSEIYNEQHKRFYSSFAYDTNLDQPYYGGNNPNQIKYGEWVRSFEFCKQDCGIEENCVPAYVFKETNRFCENDDLYVFFAHGYLAIRPNGEDIDLITTSDKCEGTESTVVGNINIILVDNDKYKITYQVNDGNEICDLSFSYANSRSFELINYLQQFDKGVTSHSFEIQKLSGTNIYITAQANVRSID